MTLQVNKQEQNRVGEIKLLHCFFLTKTLLYFNYTEIELSYLSNVPGEGGGGGVSSFQSSLRKVVGLVEMGLVSKHSSVRV